MIGLQAGLGSWQFVWGSPWLGDLWLTGFYKETGNDWLFLLLQAWRAPSLYVSSEARKVGHGHDCSLLLLSLTFKINEGRSLMGGVTMCHRKLSSREVKGWAALKKIHFLCGISLTPYFFSQNIFHLTSSCFLLFFFWLLLLSLIFPRFSPSYPALFYSSSLSISFLSISATQLMSLSAFFTFFLYLSSFKMIRACQGCSFFITLNLVQW